MTAQLQIRDEPLTKAHRLSAFACGDDALDRHLRRHARALSSLNRSRTIVAVEPERPGDPVAFATLMPGAVDVSAADQNRLDRYWQTEVPAVHVSHFAVSRTVQQLGIGTALLLAVGLRVLPLAAEGKALVLVVHAPPGPWPTSLCRHFGAVAFADAPDRLVIPLATLAGAAASL